MARICLIVFIVTINLLINLSNAAYKLCAYPYIDHQPCQLIQVGNSNVTCEEVTDSVDCAMKLENGQADFAVFTPEASVLVSKKPSFNSQSVQVIGEVRYKSHLESEQALNMVAIVKKDFSGRFEDLKNSRYCHPGVGMTSHLTDHFLKYFERMVVPQYCKDNISFAEEELVNLVNFFGPSCRPGRWANDNHLDGKLKKSYKSMCSLCDSKGKCSNNIESSSSFKSALKCLTEKSGDVTYVSYNSVKDYFWGSDSNFKNKLNDYAYLCPNKTVQPLTGNPCFWGKQPWDYVVVGKKFADELNNLLPDWLSGEPQTQSEMWKNHLSNLMIGDGKIFKKISNDNPVAIENYIDRGGVDDEINRRECRNDVRWCTINNAEYDRCSWVAAAAKTYGLKPYITCIQGDNVLDCLQKISQNKADVKSIYSEYGFIARNIFNLTTVVYEDNEIDGYYKILAVLKRNNPNIKSFYDLRRKRACFPEYNGLGWLSFNKMAKNYDLLGNIAAEDYFGTSCIPGIFDRAFVVGNKNISKTACGICLNNDTDIQNSCSPDLNIKSSNLKAILCLKYKGDIAFVNYKSLLTDRDTKTLDELITPNQFSVLCKNGKIIEQLDNPSIDDNCALATGINSEVVTRQGRNDGEVADTSELFLNLNHLFGKAEERHVMHIFDNLNGEQRLFKETTIDLVSADDDLHYKQINFYEKLLADGKDDSKSAVDNINLTSKLLIIISIIVAIK